MDRTLTLKGRCNISFLDVTPAEVFGITGIKHGVLKLNVIQNEWSEELADGSEEGGASGVKCDFSFISDEVVTADIDSAMDSTIVSMTFEFPDKSKTVTIAKAAGDRIIASVEDLKTSIKGVVSKGVGNTASDIITIA